MVAISWISSILLLAQTALSSRIPVLHDERAAVCTTKRQRKPWQNLTSVEKSNYINATLCLMSAPSKIGVSVTKSRWDDFQYAHAFNMPYVHGVGAFLPFHRYFITVHEKVLKEECGYDGSMPYWDEPLDAANISASPLWDTKTGFGSNGVKPSNAVIDGPFANLTLHFAANLTASQYVLTRNFDDCSFKAAKQANVDKCMPLQTFEQHRNCIENGPHAAGHGGVGGLMMDVSLSPGDPVFWLHHTYLDKLWWEWQAQNLSSRLTDMSGYNTNSIISFGFAPPGTNVSIPDLSCFTPGFNITLNGTLPMTMPVDRAFTDYFNDGGNVTTLNHVLNSAGIEKNATVKDVMDMRGDYICAEYF